MCAAASRHEDTLPDLETAIDALVKSNPRQLSRAEYSTIAKTLLDEGPCRFLSFSTGRDVPLWLRVNRGGHTVFLEHDPKYVQLTKKSTPEAKVYHVKYKTVLRDMEKYFASGFDRETLSMGLPDSVRSETWDVVFVDGPTGYAQNTPGRFQSIWEASRLRSAKHIFVHDCNRPAEARSCEAFIRPFWPKCEHIGKLRHFFR